MPKELEVDVVALNTVSDSSISNKEVAEIDMKEARQHSPLIQIEFKEENGEFYSYGFVATTHPDRAAQGKYKGDVLTKHAVSSIVTQINQRKELMADLASLQHDWVKENNPSMSPVGRAVMAELKEIDKLHYGAWVKTHHDKTYPQFEDVKYKVLNGYLPGYSIEYVPTATKEINLPEGNYRLIDSLEMKGYGFACGRLIANPKAVIEGYEYKEIQQLSHIPVLTKEDTSLSHKKKELKEVKKMEQTESASMQIDVKEYEAFKAFLDVQSKEKKKEEIKIMLKEAMAELVPSNKVQVKESDASPMAASVEFKEWTEIQTKELSVKEAFSRATAFANKVGAFSRVSTGKPYEFKTSGAFGNKIEMKSTLQTGTNQSTDTDYLQSAAELSDIYAPAVLAMLNQKTTLFGLLPKESWAGREAISWRAENVANASVGAYAEGAAISKGVTTRQKLREEFKFYKVGVQVTGQMIESAKSGIGDIFQIEIEAASRALLSHMNSKLFGISGAFTDADFLGLEYIADSSSYTTLYGLTRSTTNLLGASGSEFSAQAGARISKATLRTAIRTLEVNGADRGNLIFACHPLQRDIILSLLDDAQRFASTMPRAGFEGMPTFDGIPIHADKDANNDDVFCVNLGPDGVALAVQVPVTYQELAVTDDSRSGFLKFYGNMYAKAPKRSVYQVQGVATA